MTRAREDFRALLAGDEVIVQPAVHDAFTARMAEAVGFKAVALGGYALGAHLGIMEPLLSLEDVAHTTAEITRVSSLPVMVDAGAGWGEPLHVMHTVKVLEHAGAASMHMEDQIYPKRAHYHKGQEHIISEHEMLAKIRAAVDARRDPNFVIVARTDAMLTDSYEEGIRRARSYYDAGADMVMLFPNGEDQARSTPGDLPGIPLIYLNATGHRLRRGVFSIDTLAEWGWRLVDDGTATFMAAAQAVHKVLETLHQTGLTGLDDDEMLGVRNQVEDVIGLDQYFALEAATVEQ
jgi:methylisocitrate lyase